MMIPKYRLPVHLGEILLEEFIIPQHLFFLARFLKTTPEFWMNLQTQRDLAIAQQKMALN